MRNKIHSELDLRSGPPAVTDKGPNSIENRDEVPSDRPLPSERYVQGLEDELKAPRGDIRTTVEELENSNEELSTTNQKLQNKISELREVNNDITNLMQSTNAKTLFLDDDLRLTFFTPACLRVFRFVASDLGRKIDDIDGDVDMAALRARCGDVLNRGAPIEEEIATEDGARNYILKIEACSGNGTLKSTGVVCSMTDISAQSRAIAAAETDRRASHRSLAEIEQLYFTSPQAMALLAPDTTYLRINRQMAEINGLDVQSHQGENMRDIVPDLGEQIDEVFEKVLRYGEPVVGHQIEGITPARADERRLFLTDWYPIRVNSETVAVGVNFRDVTDHMEMQADLRRVMQELQHRGKNMLSNVLALVSRARRNAEADVSVLDTLTARINAL